MIQMNETVWILAAQYGSSALLSCLCAMRLCGIEKNLFKSTTSEFLRLRIGMAIVTALDIFFLCYFAQQLVKLFLIQQLGFGQIPVITGEMIVVLFLLALSYVWMKSLFPKDNGILLSGDKRMKKQMQHCLQGQICKLLFFLAWSLFLVRIVKEKNLFEYAGLLLFSVIAFLGMMHYGKLSILTVHERIEVLVDQQYKAELLNFMQIIRSQRHDFNFHMQAVAGMIEQKKYEECIQYIQTMVRNVEYLNGVLPLENPAISALMHTFLEMAMGKGIRMETEILNPLNELPCSVYEINTILGNLLQNAIDEVADKEVNDRWIHVLIMKRSRRNIIKITNPCEKKPEEYEKVFCSGYTTKQSHEGIGLATVKKITKKYEGTVYMEHETGVVSFIVRLPCREVQH